LIQSELNWLNGLLELQGQLTVGGIQLYDGCMLLGQLCLVSLISFLLFFLDFFLLLSMMDQLALDIVSLLIAPLFCLGNFINKL
jgi:hypothetical protein